jgi:hypothetical protein
MSKSFSLFLNNDEILLVCNKLGVRENEVAKSLKALILEKESSKDFPIKFLQELKSPKNELTFEEEVRQKTLSELQKMLGIKGKNENRRIKASGLYFGKNVEDYMADFMAHWNRDVHKIPEIITTLQNYAKSEFIALELTRREMGVNL